MNSLTPFLTLNCSCHVALRQVKHDLTQAGLRVLQTFDLQSARHTLHECPCPHHGTDACDCQMVILLVYGESSEPATVLLHGNGGQTWLSLANEPRLIADSKLLTRIKQALNVTISIPQI